jgi:hypothetical protein
VVAAEDTSGQAAQDGGQTPVAAAPMTPVSLASSRDGRSPAIAWLVAAMLALTVLAPPFLVARVRRRGR